MTGAHSSHIRIVLILEYMLIRAGLRLLIESQPHLAVVGEAANVDEAVEVVAREQPDVILMDLDSRTDANLEYVVQLRSAANHARVLVLNGTHDQPISYQAVHNGVAGQVHKGQAADVLFKAIEKVHTGEIWLDRTTMTNMLTSISRAREEKHVDPEAVKIALLTDRECQIVGLVGEGLKNKAIAARLNISEVTVRHHLTSIYSKLDVIDRQSLMIYAYRHGLATPPY